jgi:hypothetical protein
MKTFTAFLLASLSILPLAKATAQSSQAGLYVLKTGSAFETGCFDPCACPILLRSPMQGTFRLKQTSIDPLFTHYDVSDVRWALPNSTSNIPIVGSGTYRVGGEFSIQQQMVLDLSVSGGAVQHFDSGLVPGEGIFPDIKIKLSLHQGQSCQDTVLTLIAGPVTTSSADAAGPAVPGIRAVTPNPFRDRALFLVGVTRPDPVAVDVFDLQGRLVRHLAAEQAMSAGVHPFAWDGRADDGRESPAGIYFVRARLDEQYFFARVVRVR